VRVLLHLDADNDLNALNVVLNLFEARLQCPGLLRLAQPFQALEKLVVRGRSPGSSLLACRNQRSPASRWPARTARVPRSIRAGAKFGCRVSRSSSNFSPPPAGRACPCSGPGTPARAGCLACASASIRDGEALPAPWPMSSSLAAQAQACVIVNRIQFPPHACNWAAALLGRLCCSRIAPGRKPPRIVGLPFFPELQATLGLLQPVQVREAANHCLQDERRGGVVAIHQRPAVRTTGPPRRAGRPAHPFQDHVVVFPADPLGLIEEGRSLFQRSEASGLRGSPGKGPRHFAATPAGTPADVPAPRRCDTSRADRAGHGDDIAPPNWIVPRPRPETINASRTTAPRARQG